MDDNTKKYNLILRYVNDILKNIQKDEVTELTQFKGVSREDLMDEKHEAIFEKYKKDIFTLYDKKKIGYYRRKEVQYYFLTFLRYALRDVGYKLDYKEVKIQTNRVITIKIHYLIVKKKV